MKKYKLKEILELRGKVADALAIDPTTVQLAGLAALVYWEILEATYFVRFLVPHEVIRRISQDNKLAVLSMPDEDSLTITAYEDGNKQVLDNGTLVTKLEYILDDMEEYSGYEDLVVKVKRRVNRSKLEDSDLELYHLSYMDRKAALNVLNTIHSVGNGTMRLDYVWRTNVFQSLFLEVLVTIRQKVVVDNALKQAVVTIELMRMSGDEHDSWYAKDKLPLSDLEAVAKLKAGFLMTKVLDVENDEYIVLDKPEINKELFQLALDIQAGVYLRNPKPLK